MSTDQLAIRHQNSAILWLLIPSLALIGVPAFDVLPALRGNDEWRWPLRGPESPARLLLPIIALGLYVFLGARWLRGLSARRLHTGMSAGFYYL